MMLLYLNLYNTYLIVDTFESYFCEFFAKNLLTFLVLIHNNFLKRCDVHNDISIFFMALIYDDSRKFFEINLYFNKLKTTDVCKNTCSS